MTKQSVLNLIPELYHEKMESDSILDVEGFNRLTFNEFFCVFMKGKFKLIKTNTEQAVLSILKYSVEDQRIDMLRKFLGIGEGKIQREVMDCYFTLLKNVPLSFYKIFEDANISNYVMNLENCVEIFNTKFQNYSLNSDLFDKLIRVCEFYQGDNQIPNSGYEFVRDRFFLSRFYEKSTNYIENLIEEYKAKEKNEENVIELANMVINCNRDFEINLLLVIEIFKNNFKTTEEKVDLESFFSYFLVKNYFKIKIEDFINITLEKLENIYQGLDKTLSKLWENADMKKTGLLFYKEFESILIIILGNSENKWKISEYFKYIFFNFTKKIFLITIKNFIL